MESYPPAVSINMPPSGPFYGQGPPYAAPATAFGRAEVPSPAPAPRDYVLWSFFNTLCCCNPFCLGFIALIFSVKARDEKIARQPLLAGKYGTTAMHLNIAAFVLGTLLLALWLVLLFLYAPMLHLAT
ncbi:interferon-induced transmembrane protein 1-like [Dromaius novaehollandiae]|uniref:interferon-induced transmembrane protein 1-like n=1 Tax=Dromaius novaehollandiae TaxID=8790 RepID=UPI0031205065